MSFKHKKSKEENRGLIQKTYSLSIYPNNKQEQLLARFFGVSRYLYNKGLNLKIETYKAEKKTLTYGELAKFLTAWRSSKEWLWDVACSVEQQALLHLETAFKNFFRRVKNKEKSGFPRFKSKRGKQSFEYPAGVKLTKTKIYLPILGWVPYKNGRNITSLEIGKVTVLKTSTGKYKAQVLVKTGIKIPEKLPVTKSSITGIDLGLTSFLVASNGLTVPNPNFFKIFIKPLARINRSLARKRRGSSNWKKAKLSLARLYEKLSNQRKNFLHSTVNKLVDENQATCFKVESLNIQGLMKNHRLARSIQNASWNEFLRILEYKANWKGKTVVKVDRFYPSSKLCSQCGYKNKELKLGTRSWICPVCKIVLDRDLNAALNLKNFNREGNSRINASGEASLVRSLVERGNPVEAQKSASEALTCL